MTELLPFLSRHSGNPVALLALFLAASMLMIWRLQAIESKGFEGTVLGTLIMPYCSGFANLIFAFVMGRAGGDGKAVVENCIVNNVTNLTLILGLSAVLSGGAALAGKGAKSKARSPAQRIYRLELLMTLVALFLFTGTLWALAKDGVLDLYDGLVLVALFLFWQVVHVFEVLKNNVRKNRAFHWTIAIDLVLIAASAYAIYLSVDHLVDWITASKGRVISATNVGWLSGMLMVLPNAMLAVYYGMRGRQDIVVSSQLGDSHICIPMCIGLFALFHPVAIPEFFRLGVLLVLGAGMVHFLSIAFAGRLPRWLGAGLVGAYAYFMVQGILPG